jgi:DNA repair protein RadC
VRNGLLAIPRHTPTPRDPAPSSDDVHVTRELIKAGRLLEIDVLDHIVIGHNRFVSMKDRGLAFGESG